MTKRGGRIIRGTGDGDAFFIGRNEFAQHPDIPYEVKGLVFDIISRAQNWTVSIAGMLAINNTVGERKLHRIFRDGETAGVIKGVRNRDEHGKLGAVDYYVSDNPERVDEAILEDIRRTAEELAEMTSKGPAPARSEPHRQNSSVGEHEPHCCFPRVGFGPPKKERSKKERFEKGKKDSLSENGVSDGESPAELFLKTHGELIEIAGTEPDERPKAARKVRGRRHEYTTDFEAFWQTIPRHPNATKLAAFAEWQDLSTAEMQAACRAIPYYEAQIRRDASAQERRYDEQLTFIKHTCRWLKHRGWEPYEEVMKKAEAEEQAKLLARQEEERKQSERKRQREELMRTDPEPFIRRLVAYLSPGDSRKRGHWSDEGPSPDDDAFDWPADILREAQRRNYQLVIQGDRAAVVERLSLIIQGIYKWDQVKFGPHPGEPGCLVDELYPDVLAEARQLIEVTA